MLKFWNELVTLLKSLSQLLALLTCINGGVVVTVIVIYAISVNHIDSHLLLVLHNISLCDEVYRCLVPLYWYDATSEIWQNPIMGDRGVTLCHEYIMIWYIRLTPFSANRITSSSLVTLSLSCNRHFHWMVHKIIRTWPVMW